jgi:hypothetical protein
MERHEHAFQVAALIDQRFVRCVRWVRWNEGLLVGCINLAVKIFAEVFRANFTYPSKVLKPNDEIREELGLALAQSVVVVSRDSALLGILKEGLQRVKHIL